MPIVKLPRQLSLFLLISLSTLFFVSKAVSATKPSYQVEEIVVEPFSQSIERSGKLAFKRTLTLSFKSSGYLTKLAVDEGDSFAKEQLLASLETHELIQEKNAAYAELLQAKRNVTRIKKLLQKNVSSEQELEQAETAVETTRARYRVAFYNLNKAQIVAPFDGVVLARSTELGEFQTPGQEVLTVAAAKNNWVVKVALTSNEIGTVKLGQNVIVRLPNIGDVRGEINRIPAIANTDGGLFAIDVLLPEIDLSSGVVAGQLAQVVINSTSSEYVYRLPIEALVSVNEQGQAVIATKKVGEKALTHQTFEIFKLDNRYVYLQANQYDPQLTIITHGWQHLKINE